jgi:hypothetical protein
MAPVLPAFEAKFADVNVGIRVMAEAKSALAEFKGNYLSAGRVPEQSNGRGGCGNASGEMKVVKQSGLSELIAGRGT